MGTASPVMAVSIIQFCDVFNRKSEFFNKFCIVHKKPPLNLRSLCVYICPHHADIFKNLSFCQFLPHFGAFSGIKTIFLRKGSRRADRRVFIMLPASDRPSNPPLHTPSLSKRHIIRPAAVGAGAAKTVENVEKPVPLFRHGISEIKNTED